MADRPILFSAPMIRALLDGRKTQTRRILKPQPPIGHQLVGIYAPKLTAVFNPVGRDHRGDPDKDFKVQLRHLPKDRLWVRETWSIPDAYLDGRTPDLVIYRATPWATPGAWRPPIFMPRWASRLTLIVTDVRVERLQDITTEDARDEGVERRSPMVRQIDLFGASPEERSAIYLRACVWEYEKLWNEINGAGAWDAIDFETIDILRNGKT